MKEELDSLLPYDVTIENDLNYSFITVGGIKYIAYFICCEMYAPALENTYMFNFEHEGDKRLPDPRIRETILSIIDSFFLSHKDSIMYVCDSLDGRELFRRRLFDLWFNDSLKQRRHIERSDIYEKGEHYDLCASLFIHSSNPNKERVIESFISLKEMLI